MVFAVGVGFVIMLLGTGIFLIGQFLDTKDKRKAKAPFPITQCMDFVVYSTVLLF